MGRKPAAQVDNAPFDFGKSNQKFSDVERFCQFWAEYPDQDGLKAYLYRLSPAIDRRQTNTKVSNIDTFDTPQPSSEFLRKWGSGKYEVRLSDAKKPGPASQVARCVFTLEDSELPPVFNPSDLVVVGENGRLNQPIIQRYLSQGWVIVENQKNEAYADGRTKEPIPFSCLLPPAAAGAPAETRELAETVRALATDKQAGELAAMTSRDALLRDLLNIVVARQNAPAVDPMERAFQIAERLAPKTVDPVQVQLLEVIARMSNPQPAAAASNPLEVTRQTMGFLKEMGWAAPGESSGGGSGGFWTAVFTSLPSILEVFRPALAALAFRPAAVPAGVPVPLVPSAGLPAGGGLAGNPSGPIPGSVPANGAGEGDDEMFNVMQLMDLGQDALDAFGRGLTGFDFAHGLCCRRGGEKQYAMLYRMGKDTLMGALNMAQGAPQLSAEQKAMLQGRKADIEAFIDSFMSYADAPEK
jgi:hypothetical protein